MLIRLSDFHMDAMSKSLRLSCEKHFKPQTVVRHLGQPVLRTRLFLGADFPSPRSHKTMEKHSISRSSSPPKSPHLTHLSCIASARSHLLVDRSSAATLSIVGSSIPKLPLTKRDKMFIEHSPSDSKPLKQKKCWVLSRSHANGRSQWSR